VFTGKYLQIFRLINTNFSKYLTSQTLRIQKENSSKISVNIYNEVSTIDNTVRNI
jgi:hypothetical protein